MAEQEFYTNAQINVALKAALDAKGDDYVYEERLNGACVYSLEGRPSCIVGHVLHALDPDMFERVAAFEANQGENNGDTSFSNVVVKLNLPFETDQRRALQEVQAEQDNGKPWGGAVATGWIARLGEKL